jgi:oligosaccharide repeat unit polymerase
VRADKVGRPSFTTRYLTNPFAAYAVGFLVALAVYSLGYSDLYPPLDQSLVYFLLATCVASGLLARAVANISMTSEYGHESLRVSICIFLVIAGVFAAEVVANGGIPLLLLASGGDVNYQEFGIPTVHVAFIGFADFYAVYWFDLYVLRRGKGFLALSAAACSTSLLIVSRGAFIITLLAFIFVYVQRRGFDRKLFLGFAAFIGAILWGFALVGDLRTHGATGESIILTIGAASDRFVNSNVPTEVFWPYLYVSSPLANLQLNVTNRVATDTPATYFALEFLPDFVSKRIVSEATIAESTPLRIVNELTVSTMYGRGFFLWGWVGLLLSFAYFTTISLACLKILQGSKYYVAACSILSSLAFLSIFDNMYVFAGGVTQVLVALLLLVFERRDLRFLESHV